MRSAIAVLCVAWSATAYAPTIICNPYTVTTHYHSVDELNAMWNRVKPEKYAHVTRVYGYASRNRQTCRCTIRLRYPIDPLPSDGELRTKGHEAHHCETGAWHP